MIRVFLSVALLIGFLALIDYALTGGSNVDAFSRWAQRAL